MFQRAPEAAFCLLYFRNFIHNFRPACSAFLLAILSVDKLSLFWVVLALRV